MIAVAVSKRLRKCPSTDVHFSHLLRDGPTGNTGVGNKSRWQTEETFAIFMKNFVSHIQPSPENAILFVFDNHSSHISHEVLGVQEK
jgi:hypothetical protein